MSTAQVHGKRLKLTTEDSVSIDGKDKVLRVNGTTAIILLILAGVLFFGTKMIDRWSGSALEVQTRQIQQEHQYLSNDHKQITSALDKIGTTLEVQTFLMTKTEDERQKYKLDVPDALRDKRRP